MFRCKLPLPSLKWIWRHCTPSAFNLAKDLAKISFAFVLFHSLRKQSTFRDATTGIPAKWHLRLNRAQKFRTFDALLARAWWCFWLVSDLFHPIRSTTDLLVVMRHQYGVFALVSQTSFPEETSQWWRREISALFSVYLMSSTTLLEPGWDLRPLRSCLPFWSVGSVVNSYVTFRIFTIFLKSSISLLRFREDHTLNIVWLAPLK